MSQQDNPNLKKPTISALAQYGFFALPLAFDSLPIYIFAPDFYAVEYGVSIAAIGIAVLVMRLFDALQDPFIGHYSDTLNPYRKHIIALGVACFTLGFLMLFNPLAAAPLAWLCASFVLCTFGFSVVTINMQALGSLWQVPSASFTTVMATREGFSLIGVLLAASLPPVLEKFYDTKEAFTYYSLAIIPLVIIGTGLFYKWLGQAKLDNSKAVSLKLGALFEQKISKYFFGVYFLNSVASAIPATLLVFFVRDYLKAEPYLGMFLAIYFLAGAAAMPIWQKLSKSKSKIYAWGGSMVLATATFIWTIFIPEQAIVAFSIICALSGMAVGANLALPTAIAADLIRDRKHQSASNRYYAAMTFFYKSSLAVAAGLVLPSLEFLGFEPNTQNGVELLPYAYALVPCVLLVLTIALWARLVALEAPINKKD